MLIRSEARRSGRGRSLAARLDRAVTPQRRGELTQLAGGKSLADLSATLLRPEVQIDFAGDLIDITPGK